LSEGVSRSGQTESRHAWLRVRLRGRERPVQALVSKSLAFLIRRRYYPTRNTPIVTHIDRLARSCVTLGTEGHDEQPLPQQRWIGNWRQHQGRQAPSIREGDRWVDTPAR
jgi:hypothetical protein